MACVENVGRSPSLYCTGARPRPDRRLYSVLYKVQNHRVPPPPYTQGFAMLKKQGKNLLRAVNWRNKKHEENEREMGNEKEEKGGGEKREKGEQGQEKKRKDEKEKEQPRLSRPGSVSATGGKATALLSEPVRVFDRDSEVDIAEREAVMSELRTRAKMLEDRRSKIASAAGEKATAWLSEQARAIDLNSKVDKAELRRRGKMLKDRVSERAEGDVGAFNEYGDLAGGDRDCKCKVRECHYFGDGCSCGGEGRGEEKGEAAPTAQGSF